MVLKVGTGSWAVKMAQMVNGLTWDQLEGLG